MRTLPAGFIAPCLPIKTTTLPPGGQWLHEIKHDGFRLMARRDAASVRLLTRNGYNWSARFPAILETASALQAHSCLIDGEAVAPLKKIPPAGERGGIVGGPTRGEGQVHRAAPT
jgi:ATP-dependent DNA ligase